MKFGQELSFDTPISSQTFIKDPKFTRLKTDIGHSQLYKRAFALPVLSALGPFCSN